MVKMSFVRIRKSTIDVMRKGYESRHSGLDPESSLNWQAYAARRWMPASIGMTLAGFVRWINSLKVQLPSFLFRTGHPEPNGAE
jgi:hypothetical protein